MNAVDIGWLTINHALQIAVVAAVVGCAVKLFAVDRPHLAHAMWALVLLKSLTPPIVASPTSPFSWMASYEQLAGADAAMRTSDDLRELTSSPTRVRIAVEEVETQEPMVSDKLATPTRHTPTLLPWTAGLIAWVLIAWVSSSFFLLVVHAFRFAVFRRMVSRASVDVPVELVDEVALLRRQLGIKRDVHIAVLDALIGPAVMGIVRPTLLLPRVLVEDSTTEELRVLIAHELVHVRRGDLIWSAGQVVAAALWWFHPAVWLANRLLTRESERSCDEETIVSLGCRPATYARSLLSVLETKHKLTAAPLVPGVRTVDVTSKRLERIMRMRHGSHPRPPRWVSLGLLASALIVLPGAAWLQAQDELAASQTTLPSETDSRLGQAAAESIPNGQTKTAPESKPASSTDAAKQLVVELLILELPRELVQQLQKESSVINAIPAKAQSTSGPLALPQGPQGVVQASVTVAEQASLAGTSDNDVALSGGVQSDLGVAGVLAVKSLPAVQPAAMAQDTDVGTQWLLNDSASQLLQQWLRNGDHAIKVLSRPKLTTLSGQKGSVVVGKEHSFVTGFGNKGQKIVKVVQAGIQCECTATLPEDLAHASAQQIAEQARFAHLSMTAKLTEIPQVDSFTFTSPGFRQQAIQQPTIVCHEAKTAVNLPLGTNLAMTMGVKKTDAGETLRLCVVNVQVVKPTAEAKSIVYERYKRVPVLGPVVAAGKPRPDAVPSDEEVIAAYNNLWEDSPEMCVSDAAECRITKELIADYVDPPLFYPTIGQAQRSHRHFKCSVMAAGSNDDRIGTVYIDYNWLTLKEEK